MSRLIAPLVAVLLGSSGCVWMAGDAELGPRISPAVLDTIVTGRTKRAEVLARLGPPDEYLRSEVTTALGDDETRVSGAIRLGNRAIDVLTWRHDRLRFRGRWWILALTSTATLRSDVLMIVFDADDVVAEVSFREAEE
jgi:hypothetical protein